MQAIHWHCQQFKENLPSPAKTCNVSNLLGLPLIKNQWIITLLHVQLHICLKQMCLIGLSSRSKEQYQNCGTLTKRHSNSCSSPMLLVTYHLFPLVVSTFGRRPHAAFVDTISVRTRRFITDNPLTCLFRPWLHNNTMWSQEFTSFRQIVIPSPIGTCRTHKK
jgi:hypothetical protein